MAAAHPVAGATELIGPTGPVSQGEVVEVILTGPHEGSKVKGFWQAQPLDFFEVKEKEYRSLLGIDFRLPPGIYPLEVEVDSPGNSRSTYRTSIEVAKKEFGEQSLTLPENMVTLDAETLKRVRI